MVEKSQLLGESQLVSENCRSSPETVHTELADDTYFRSSSIDILFPVKRKIAEVCCKEGRGDRVKKRLRLEVLDGAFERRSVPKLGLANIVSIENDSLIRRTMLQQV